MIKAVLGNVLLSDLCFQIKEMRVGDKSNHWCQSGMEAVKLD